MATNKLMTLSRHIREQERLHPGATGVFSNLLDHLCLAAKLIAREVNKAGLVEILGLTGETNIQGEEVKKLDAYANEIMIRMLDHSGYLCVMASEENEDLIQIPKHHAKGRYVLLFDPLDGSSNIDANVSIGTIFSILRKHTDGEDGQLSDCLQPGVHQVAAGYIIYGSSTMLVYTTGSGVHGFTLDPSVGEFILSHPDIRIPQRGKIFSVNMGNFERFDEGVKSYLRHLMSEEKSSGRPYSLRYIGSLCADFHRNLLYGGIFLYPADKKSPNGKLRLLYEANPLSWIVQQAGGRASNGTEAILEIEPKELHQRVPLFIGSAEDVLEAEEFVQGKRS
jgi:fructose-1,6-bisphosphatase I